MDRFTKIVPGAEGSVHQRKVRVLGLGGKMILGRHKPQVPLSTEAWVPVDPRRCNRNGVSVLTLNHWTLDDLILPLQASTSSIRKWGRMHVLDSLHYKTVTTASTPADLKAGSVPSQRGKTHFWLQPTLPSHPILLSHPHPLYGTAILPLSPECRRPSATSLLSYPL